jgi:hypothetical protein
MGSTTRPEEAGQISWEAVASTGVQPPNEPMLDDGAAIVNAARMVG